jgi:tetratricopeptide (TPR) repeat protein
LQPLQREFLLKALAYYRAFSLEDDADPCVRAEAGVASLRVGEIRRQLGEPAEAERAYRRAIDVLEAAGGGSGAQGRPEVQEALGRSYGGLGELLLETGRPDEARRTLGRGVELTRAFVDRTADSPTGRRARASGYQRLGTMLRLAGRLPEAEAAYRQALEANQALGEPRRLRQAGTYADLGIVLDQTGRPDAARQSYRRAAELYEALVESDPGVPLYRRELAGTLLNLGVLLASEPGGIPEAERAFRRALALYERLSADAPAVTQFRHELALALRDLGNLLGDTGRTRPSPCCAAR